MGILIFATALVSNKEYGSMIKFAKLEVVLVLGEEGHGRPLGQIP